MVKKWIAWINLGLGGGVSIFILLALLLTFMQQAEIEVLDSAAIKANAPKNAFTLAKQSYEAIGEPVFVLHSSPLNMQLPDLKRYLVYYGKNGRPDADSAHPLLFFAFTGNKAPCSVKPGERLYLLYDKKQTPAQYVFSPSNAPTAFWIEALAEGSEARIKVGMKDENDNILHEPESYASFSLPEKEFLRLGTSPWELGKWRVDGTLFARQKARWFGPDRFLERHGGEEFIQALGKQRIDFGEPAEAYSVFVGPSDCLIWEDDQWKVVKPGAESLGHPLMLVKKIDERLMNLELWDVDGKGKIVINLLKTAENWIPQNIQQSFKFVGARTRSQFVFEINKERMLLSPQDWLLLTDTGWKKLTTPEEIDEYVNRKTTGALFVFDGIQRKDDHQVLLGTMFNSSRTESQAVELPVLKGAGSSAPIDNPKGDHNKLVGNGTPFEKNKTYHEAFNN